MRFPILCAAASFAVLFSSCTSVRGGLVEQNVASEYYAIAEGYAGLSKYDKAILYYRKAALRKEYANAASYGLGRAYALSGKWQEACDVFSALYEQDPENSLVAGAYAYALASNGQTDEALAMYEGVWRRNSDDPVGMRNYAAMLVLAARYEQALALIADLKEKYPDTDAVKGIDELEKKAADGLKPPAENTEDETPANPPGENPPPAGSPKPPAPNPAR